MQKKEHILPTMIHSPKHPTTRINFQSNYFHNLPPQSSNVETQQCIVSLQIPSHKALVIPQSPRILQEMAYPVRHDDVYCWKIPPVCKSTLSLVPFLYPLYSVCKNIIIKIK